MFCLSVSLAGERREGGSARRARRGSNYSNVPISRMHWADRDRARVFYGARFVWLLNSCPSHLHFSGLECFPKLIVQSDQCIYLVNFNVFLNCNPLHDWRSRVVRVWSRFARRRPSAKQFFFICLLDGKYFCVFSCDTSSWHTRYFVIVRYTPINLLLYTNSISGNSLSAVFKWSLRLLRWFFHIMPQTKLPLPLWLCNKSKRISKKQGTRNKTKISCDTWR